MEFFVFFRTFVPKYSWFCDAMKQLFTFFQYGWKRTPWQVVLMLFAAPFLVRNLLLPMVGDDFSYAFIWDGEHWGNLMDDISTRERIGSFYDILLSQWSHYFTWGGRTGSMLCIQFFAWVGKIWFDMANTGVFVLLMLVLYWLSVGEMASPADHKGTFLWVMVCMQFGVLDYVSTMLWMTGACVYLWTGLWECLFLLPWVTRRHPSASLMALSGLVAGWSEEGGSLATVALTTCFLLVYGRQRRLRRWMVMGYVFLLIGCALLMLAPGSIHREELMWELAPDYVLPAEKLFSAEMFWDNFIEGFLPILLCESFLLVPIVCFLSGKRESLREKGKGKNEGGYAVLRIVAFTGGGLLVLCAMMFAPEFTARTGFHSTLFLTVASAAAFKETMPWLKHSPLVATPLRRMAALVVGGLLGFLGLFLMVGCFWIEGSYRRQFDERLATVLPQRNEEVIVVPAFYIPYHLDRYTLYRSLTEMHLVYGGDLESKPTDNRSLMYAQYYGLKAIRIDRKVDWKKRDGK